MADPKSTGPKDVFLQLLVMVTLYFSAIHIGVVLFQLVNHWVPDPLTAREYWSAESARNVLRWALATLVVVFPVYLWATWFTERDLAAVPEKRMMRTRRWLTHLTMFAAAVIIIGDLVHLVYNFLTGELSERFVLKVLAVLAIASAVFTYELLVIRCDAGKPAPWWMRFFVAKVIALTTIAIIAGFIVAGTPGAERLRQFDTNRVNDLSSIQGQVVTYWQTKNALPQSLDQLRDSISGYVPPMDPQTSTAYAYRITSPLSFELCATFVTDGTTNGKAAMISPMGPYGAENWAHGIGRTCFTRTIDPDRYRRTDQPFTKPPPIPAD